jgi:hypothetical protein
MEIELLCGHHTLVGFDCGSPMLNDVIVSRVAKKSASASSGATS